MLYKSISKISSVALIFSLLIFCFQAEAKPFLGRTVQLTLQKIAPGTGKILIDFDLPEHHDFAYEAPSSVWVRFKNPEVFKTLPIKQKSSPLNLSKLPHSISYQASLGKTVVVIDLRAHFCDKDTQICLTDTIRVKFPVQVETQASQKINLNILLRSKTEA